MNTTLKYQEVTIRRPRRCHCCTDLTPKGEDMWYWVGVNDGDFMTSYTCLICESFIKSVKNFWQDFEDGLEYGGILECDGYKEFKKQRI